MVPYLSAVLLALLLLAFFLGGIFVGYLKFQSSEKSLPLAVVVMSDEEFSEEYSEADIIGDFIMHHEYVTADPEVLNEPDEATEQADVAEPIEEVVVMNATDKTEEARKRLILDRIMVETPLLAVVIDDMGINQTRTKDIISLEAPLTSSFLTYGKNLAQLAAAAEAAGHEIMIHAPMEPKVPASLAPDTLMTDMDVETIRNMFGQMLAKFDGITVSGINNHMGSKFTEDKEKLGGVMNILKDRQMFFLDSKTTASSKGRELAEEDGVDFAGRDVFLDNENDYAYIMKQLEAAEKIAAKKGFAIAICHPKSQTYLALKDWLKTLGSKNIKLVHASEIVRAINVEQ